MCVLIVKPAGVPMPAKNILRAAMRANPDGFGFVSPAHFYKGLSAKMFLSGLARVSDAEPCIIHCRLATHGSIRAANCHPFRRGGLWFAHNGILDITPQGDRTDSETAFARYIAPAVFTYGLDSPRVDSVIASLIGGSKFALMQGDTVRTFGRFFMRDGCMYSNLRFLPVDEWLRDLGCAGGRVHTHQPGAVVFP